MNLEPFANYQDVKTKTVNWCNKMQKTGLLTSEQFDECVSTFTNVKNGILPKEFKTPNTGLSRNYSLYNTQMQELTPNVSGENSNTVLLLNNEGFYMGCRTDNSIYFIKDINDETVNQQEIYFTLIPQNDNVYAILSPYGKYLIANAGPQDANDKTIPTGQSSRQDWCSAFTGKTIGPMTSWNVKKYESENSNDSISTVTFESIQLSNFFLSSTQNSQDNSLQIVYGSDDTTKWNIIPKRETITSSENVNINTENIVEKDNIITSLESIKSQIICIQAFKDSLSKIQYIVKNNYTNIKNYISQIINNQEPNPAVTYPIITNPNITNPNIPSELGPNPINKIVETFKNNYSNNINMSTNEKYDVINNIISMQNTYLQQLDGDVSSINIILSDLMKKEASTLSDYNNFKQSLISKIADIKLKIDANKEIMKRQTTDYDKLNNDYTYIDSKKVKVEKVDEISKLNIDLISNYSNNNSILVKVYPFIIVIIFLFLLYLIYLTYKKLMLNVYNQY